MHLPKQLAQDLTTPTTGLIDRIAKTAENQQSGAGGFHGGTTSKSVLRDALLLELRGINRTAGAMAEATGHPEIMDSFRMPHGASDTALVAKASAMADAADPKTADFVAYGHDPAFVGQLRDHITAFEQAEESQDTGEQTQAGSDGGVRAITH